MIKRIGTWLVVIALCMSTFAVPAAAADTKVARCNLMLRKQATTNSEALFTIPGGTELPVLGASGGWTKTSYKGHTGFVSTNYLMELTRNGYYPLKEGDDNPYVKELQKRLIELGYLAGPATSKFDAEVRKAVISFQKSNRMTQDGIAGGETQRVLYSDGAIASSGGTAGASSTGSAATGASDASGSSAASGTTLKLGSRGEDVRTLQTRLIELGYLTSKADGIYGPGTQTAVKDFQKRSGLTEDGKAGQVTQNLLYSAGAIAAEGTVAAAIAASATPPPTDYKPLKRGMTSDDVKALQQALKDLGYMTASATGYFGSATQAAVEAFQRANNLKVDGIAGAATQQTLFGTGAKVAGGSAAGSAAASYATLKEGMKSSAVTTMQNKLRALGYMTANATGYFGSATKTAVIAFQRANNLVADGVAGAQTLTRLYSDSAVAAGASGGTSSGGGVSASGAGKMSGPPASSVKLLHWFNSVKPAIKSGSTLQVYDPATGYGFKLKAYSLGRHCDSEPLTAEDTLYMNAAFGNVTTWTPKPVWVQLPNGTWVLATMHNTPHLSGSISNNSFDGHLCVHFLRDLEECQKNDPNYGMQHQRAIREAWKKLTGQTVN